LNRAWQRLIPSITNADHTQKFHSLQEKSKVRFKQKVFEHYQQVMNEKVFSLQKTLEDLIDSTRNETKSSAGDKYETGRAMLQIEQDNVRKQLKEALEQKAVFDKTDINLGGSQITKGSVVKTDKGYFFVSVALGKINVDGIKVIALSPQSPLGSKLVGLKTTESVTMNGTTYTIENIE
jgi:transcription elongation GreA/GreB family factor